MESYHIPMEDLKPNFLYRINARNSSTGVWIPAQKGFLIAREKFGDVYPFVEYHYDTGPPFGTVKPIHEVGKFPIDCQGYSDTGDFPADEFVKTIRELSKPVYEKIEWERERERKESIERRRQLAQNPEARANWLAKYNESCKGNSMLMLTKEQFEQRLREEGFDVVE